MNKVKIKVFPSVTYQTIESFGMSTAWWGKMVGSWDHISKDVMKLFYDPQEGIGLTNIRYNIGAGSSESTYIKDPTRRSETFEVSKGVYDFNRNQYTLKLVDYALEYGATEIVFFSISPPERMTNSGKVCGSIDKDNPSNHKHEFYEEYCDYILDIVDHFLQKGYPIKYVSPINEPQWEWGVKSQTQEGCYYTISEVTKLYDLFVQKIEERQIDIELAGHDGGEWITAIDYAKDMFQVPRINRHMTRLDSHSYWTNKEQKLEAKKQFDLHFPLKKLVMSEWCEMKGGGLDYGMDSALVLANTVHEDLSILDVVSWQYWTGCEREIYQHKVALMYIKDETKEVLPTKKFYAFGQFTKYIRPGSKRIKSEIIGNGLKVSSYIFNNKIVSVLINDTNKDIQIEFTNGTPKQCVITDETRSLQDMHFEGIIPKRSICTVLFEEEFDGN